MLRSVLFKNFVNFKEKQFLCFQDAGPFIFIGENGSGKSSVFEGIRRCLRTKLSTSVSSVFEKDKLSYFICVFETDTVEKEYIICGVVVIPDKLAYIKDGSAAEGSKTGPESRSDANQKSYYKFAYHRTKEYRNERKHKYLFRINTSDCPIHKHEVMELNMTENADCKERFFESIFKNRPEVENVESFLTSEFNPENLEINVVECDNECDPLNQLQNSVVFTFPLRSIGPLQWSENKRIRPEQRNENYTEAEKRCEIIKCFLQDENEIKFDRTRERQLFKALTKSDAYNFELTKDDDDDGKRRLLVEGGKYALLKTPEGILEAKAFSILMSGKTYKTIFLEEPDRGMHPQFIERMVHLIKQNQKDKCVILTTHNTAFITPWSLSDCFVFRQADNKECCIVSGKAIAKDTKKPEKDRIFMKKLRLLTSDHLSEILFAKKVLFCEGDTDFLFITELKQQILSGEAKQMDIFQGETFNYDRLESGLVGLTVIKLNGKGNTELCLTVSEMIKLEAIFLLDKESEGRTEKFKDKSNIFFWAYGDIEDMVIKMCQSNDCLMKKLGEQNVTVNLTKFQQKKNRNEKLFLRDDVTVSNIREGVRLILEQCETERDLVSFIKFLYIRKGE